MSTLSRVQRVCFYLRLILCFHNLPGSVTLAVDCKWSVFLPLVQPNIGFKSKIFVNWFSLYWGYKGLTRRSHRIWWWPPWPSCSCPPTRPRQGRPILSFPSAWQGCLGSRPARHGRPRRGLGKVGFTIVVYCVTFMYEKCSGWWYEDNKYSTSMLCHLSQVVC